MTDNDLDEFPGHPFLADLTPRSRGVEIRYYGRRVRICPPLVAHAAILRFFKRHESDDDEDDWEDEDEDDYDSGDEGEVIEVIEVDEEVVGIDRVPSEGQGSETTTTADEPTPTNANPKARTAHRNPTLAKLARKYPSVPLSTIHDRDWLRLTRCYDASSSPGMKVRDWRNAFQGCWEGNFSFFEFEAFSEMVAGNSSALYQGPFGQQAQVWKITETFVWPIKERPAATASTSKAEIEPPSQYTTEDEDEDEEEGIFALNDDRKRKRKGKGKEPASHPSAGLPLNGPATNAGYPTSLPAPSPAGLSTPTAEQTTLAETIKHQVEAIEGYEIVPESELDGAIARGEEGLEILLSGTGHSAWGRFILKGRVRTFDGMCSLVKEYAVSPVP